MRSAGQGRGDVGPACGGGSGASEGGGLREKKDWRS